MTGQDFQDALVACVGGGSNAIGLFHPFVEDESVAMYGAEAAGLGVDTGARSYLGPRVAQVFFTVLSWMCSKMPMVKFLKPSLSQQVWTILVSVQNILITTISNVPAMFPVTDEEALEGFQLLSRVEGIIPVLESSHAIAFAVKLAKELRSRQVNDCLPIQSWRDKDVVQVKDRLEADAAKKGEAHA